MGGKRERDREGGRRREGEEEGEKGNIESGRVTERERERGGRGEEREMNKKVREVFEQRKFELWPQDKYEEINNMVSRKWFQCGFDVSMRGGSARMWSDSLGMRRCNKRINFSNENVSFNLHEIKYLIHRPSLTDSRR